MAKDEFYLTYDLNDQRVKYLVYTDETLGRLIKYIGTSELVIEKDGFNCLVKYIIGQQISDKARATIWKRLFTILDEVSPAVVLLVSDSDFRKVGMSSSKVSCIKMLAEYIVEKKIEFGELQSLSNEQVVSKLTAIKGIGK